MSKAAANQAVGLEAPVEGEPHLRAILESQPVVLCRVGADGTFLAVNGAGLSMLGAAGLEQVLGRSILSLVGEGDQKACKTFLERAAGGQRGSIEVELVDFTGAHHTLEVHASPHPGAPDGIASALVTFRDVTEARRLEQSLVDAAARQTELENAHEAERARLLADLEQARRAGSDQAAVDEQLTELERRLAEAEESRAALVRAHHEELERLRAELEEARARADAEAAARASSLDDQLADLRGHIEALESERQQLIETAAVVRAEADARQQSIDELQARLDAIELERQQAVDAAGALRLDLDEREATIAGLTSRLELLEADHRQAEEAREQLARELESRTSLANELASRIEALEAEQAGLRTSAEATLEQLQQLEERYATDTGALRDALNEALGEQARLAQSLASGEEEAAARTARIAELEGLLADERAAFDAKLSEAYDSHAARIQELEAAHDARVRDLEDAHAARIREVETSLDQRIAELEEAHAARLRELEEAHAASRRELEAALAEARATIEGLTAERDRVAEEKGAEVRRLEDALLAAVESERAARKALADEIAARTTAERAHKQLVEALGKLAGGVVVDTAAVAPAAVTKTREIATTLESELARRFGDGIEFSLLVASGDSTIALPAATIVDVLGAFADSRRVSMLSGRATVELADVEVDDGAGRARGLSPGAYVLAVMQVDGPGAQQGIAPEVFDSGDPRGWREMRKELQQARTTLVGSGGQIWVTREGASILVLEFYLPRADGGER
ncbi:MAG TPA: PAS domain-containing protein [Vicinamibacterales bacterium]